jgi:probable HAF family extracellular repeat protein
MTALTTRHVAALAAGALLGLASTSASACPPRASILKSPRAGSHEVQAKALNDGGDVVGFANGRDGTFHAILWKRGKAARAVDLGVLPGYVSSEAYGVNDQRVVFGLLYDKKERTFPFRWKDGRMTLLRGPSGRIQLADVPDRNALNERGEIVATLIVAGQRRAVRWSRRGKARFLSPLPGHTWTNAWSIGGDGVVSGWSRRLPNDDGENNPVIWTKSGHVIPLKTAPGRADGAAEATNRSGLTVGYLGNLGTDTDPESDQVAVWRTQSAAPLLIGPADPYAYGELVDVNDRGQAIGMSGTFTKEGFPVAQPAIWRTGWQHLRAIPIPGRARGAHPVVVAQLTDINARGAIVGNAYGLAAKDYGALRRIYPVRWTCPFGQ